jgi:hypothetical protein
VHFHRQRSDPNLYDMFEQSIRVHHHLKSILKRDIDRATTTTTTKSESIFFNPTSISNKFALIIRDNAKANSLAAHCFSIVIVQPLSIHVKFLYRNVDHNHRNISNRVHHNLNHREMYIGPNTNDKYTLNTCNRSE